MERRYENEVVGFNARMTDIHAAIGRVQLGKVGAWTKQRQDNAAYLDANLQGVVVPQVAAGATHVYHQYTIRVSADRDGFAAALASEHGIGTGVYYPIPNHRLPSFGLQLDLPETERAAAEVLSLPVHPSAVSGGPRAHRHGREHRCSSRRLMAALRAGLIGLGMMGRHHARVLRSIDGVELVAVADPGGDPHGVAQGLQVHQDVAGLIRAGIDYCMVAVPTAQHEEVALQLAEAGVHAMVEKPLAPDVAAATRTAEAFESRGLVGAVGHIERYNPALQGMRARIARGELGEVYQVVTRRQGPFPSRIADVGVVKDLATHDIDLTSWVIQRPYASVSARTAFKSGRQHEDLVAVVGLLEGGVIASHLVNWLSPFKERVTVVTGTTGALVADTLTADLTFYANGSLPTAWEDIANFRGVTEGDVVRYGISKPEPLRTEHEAFRDKVLGKDADIVTMRQGLRTVEVAEAVIRSANEDRVVSLAPVG